MGLNVILYLFYCHNKTDFVIYRQISRLFSKIILDDDRRDFG